MRAELVCSIRSQVRPIFSARALLGRELLLPLHETGAQSPSPRGDHPSRWADGGAATPAAAMECDVPCNPARPLLEGRVLYVQGGALDHPLDVVRVDGYTDVIVPVYNWRGRAVDGLCVNGSAFCATDFNWPARTENATFGDPPVTDPVYGGPVAWGGSLLDTQKDGSGLVYKRNRYYDPASGRFTQVDPIGLGGGLNAYGFGGGDQVSYTDPFGLLQAPAIPMPMPAPLAPVAIPAEVA
ncbi:MAG TPA: RHS repeat-associated core domain-containing protein, partial [Gemmatimonadaceae bacterium]|nr:RHS repeat-associated core domain-containing protein [Gemmatimonadaceae bacterium]